MDPITQRHRGYRMPRRRHRRVLLPAVARGIVALHLAVHAGFQRLAALDDAALAAHAEDAAAIDHHAMPAACGRHRRLLDPGVARRQVHVVRRGVVLEGVEPPADHMDQAVMCDAADMVARAGQRPAEFPFVGRGVVDLVPADAGALGRRVGGAADQVELALEGDRRRRAARPRQPGDLGPFVGLGVIGEGEVVAAPVLLDEAAERIDPARQRHDRHMVGPARQRGGVVPAVLGGDVDGVVGAIEPALAIAADDVHAAGPFGCPGHFAARDRHLGALDPAAGRAGRGRAVGDPLRLLLRRQVVRLAALEDIGEGHGRGLHRPQMRVLLGERGRGEQARPREQGASMHGVSPGLGVPRDIGRLGDCQPVPIGTNCRRKAVVQASQE